MKLNLLFAVLLFCALFVAFYAVGYFKIDVVVKQNNELLLKNQEISLNNQKLIESSDTLRLIMIENQETIIKNQELIISKLK